MDIENQPGHLFRQPFLPLWVSIPLYLLTSFVFIGVLGEIAMLSSRLLPESDAVYYAIGKEFAFALATLLGAWGAAVLFLKYVDFCPVSELGMSIGGRWKDCLAGLLLAVVLYLVGFTISLALGGIEIVSVKPDAGVLAATFCVFFVAAAMEEVTLRGYIQGRLMAKMNKFRALIIASLIFSVMHIFNSGIGFLPLLNLFLAGLMLGASYMYTRNLWFPIILHTAWNWIQGSILGYEVSGTRLSPSVITIRLSEENIVNGGAFGFEGSIICTFLLLAATTLIVWWYERRNKA